MLKNILFGVKRVLTEVLHRSTDLLVQCHSRQLAFGEGPDRVVEVHLVNCQESMGSFLGPGPVLLVQVLIRCSRHAVLGSGLKLPRTLRWIFGCRKWNHLVVLFLVGVGE